MDFLCPVEGALGLGLYGALKILVIGRGFLIRGWRSEFHFLSRKILEVVGAVFQLSLAEFFIYY